MLTAYKEAAFGESARFGLSQWSPRGLKHSAIAGELATGGAY